MKNRMIKSKSNQEGRGANPEKAIKVISEEDIRIRTYEIYHDNGGNFHDPQGAWFRAEKELKERIK